MISKPLREYQFSLRARATTWYVGLLAVALVIFSFAVYVGVRSYLHDSLQLGLKGTAQTIIDDFLTKLPTKGDAWVLGEIRESYEASASDHYIRISTGSNVFYQTGDMRDPSIRLEDIALPQALTVKLLQQTIDGQLVMIYVLPYRAPDGRAFEVEAGTSLYFMRQTLSRLGKILALATIVVLIAATIGGYLLMKQPLRPLVVLTEKAANIGKKELGERLPVIPTGDELERLTHSLNGMIDRLEEALDHNHRFSADASHELRTPLTIMRGEIEEMLRIEDLPPHAVGNLVSTLEEIDRMSRIVNSLMTITRLDAGGERMDRQVLDLSELVRTTTEHMRLLAEEKGLPLTCSCERGIEVYADPMRMKQVLVNLIDNAIKYTQSRPSMGDVETDEVPFGKDKSSSPLRGTGEIEVSLFSSEMHAHLKISDHGIGISPEALPQIFDRFYRADQTRSRGAGGVGLGLAIAKAIVAAHDGSISVTSILGQGSTLSVQLPLASILKPVAAEELARRHSRYQAI